ncbi:hypothetical protein ACFQ3W_05075 [Paenibacillus puldeungensis]|uniref:Uncharacterized protein n=1 Tax=Paenibacillus puldeungensis TaxID=696536 RepID=A0ABW3RUX5_9BACL
MTRIMFWDPGHGGAAHLAVGCAVTLALHHTERMLLFNVGRASYGVEEGLRTEMRDTDGLGQALHFSEHGLDALLRVSESGRLTKANFSDYTLPLVGGRLDLACGCRSESLDATGTTIRDTKINDLLMVADQSYDLLMLHIHDKRPIVDTFAAQNCDVTLVVLEQKRVQLDAFFSELSQMPEPERRKLNIAIYPYDPQSSWSLANIKRRYSVSLSLFSIPYNTEFADAWNSREALSFFRKYKLVLSKGGAREALLGSYRKLSQCLLDRASNISIHSTSGKGA